MTFFKQEFIAWNLGGYPKPPLDLRSRTRRRTFVKTFSSFSNNRRLPWFLFEEIRLTEKHFPLLTRLFPRYVGFFNSDSSTSAGTAIFVPRVITERFVCEHHILEQNHSHYVIVNSPQPFLVCNVYINTKSWGTKLHSLKQIDLPPSPSLRLLGGDWNFVENRKDVAVYTSHYDLPVDFKATLDHFLVTNNLKESHHDAFTHYRLNKQLEHTSAARLDRFYLGCPEALVAAFVPSTTLAKPGITLKRKPATHHEPIRLSFRKKKDIRSQFDRIPQWVANTKVFANLFKEVLRRRKHLINSLRDFNRAAHATAKEAKKLIKVSPSQLVESITAKIEAVRRITQNPYDHRPIKRLISKFPDLASYFPKTLPTKLCPLKIILDVENTLNTKAEPWEDALETWTRSPGPGTNFVKKVKLYLPSTRRRIRELLIEGKPTSDPWAMGKAVRTFWGELWTFRKVNKSDIDSFLDSYNQTYSTPVSFPTLEDSQDFVKQSKNSSAGPQGIPFLVYRIAPDLAGKLILADLKTLGYEDRLPWVNYNHSLLYLIPKKLTGLPTDTRPIQVPNTSNRLTSGLIKEAIHTQVAEVVSKDQKAFVKGRRILEHVIDITSTYYSSLSKKQQAFILLLDFKKAYDSVSHDFLLALLDKIGFPVWVKNVVRNLLKDQVAHLTRPFAGLPIGIGRGVKQGCPLSPLLFILVIDTLVRRLETLEVTSKAFADDIGLVFTDISSLIAIQEQVDLYCTATGAEINQTKTVLIPSLPITSALRALVKASRWPKVKIRKRGLYLGFWVGNDVDVHVIFDDSIIKLRKRFRDFLPFRAGFSITKRLITAKVFLLPLLSYHQSVYVIPREHHSTIERLLRSWIIPFNSLKLTTLSVPSRFFGLHSFIAPVSFTNAAAILAQKPQIVTTPLAGKKYNTNDPNPINSRQAALDFFIDHHPPWQGGTTQRENTKILVHSPTHLEEHFENIRTALKRWCKKLKSWTQTTMAPHVRFEAQAPEEPKAATLNDRVKRNHRQVVQGKKIHPRKKFRLGVDPQEIEIPTQDFPEGHQDLILSVPALLNNWQAANKDLSDQVRTTTIQLVFNALATSSRTRFFAKERPCHFCGGEDTAFHFFQLCQPVQKVLQGILPLAALYFDLHQPGSDPPPAPVETPETLFYNKVPFGDRLLSFPPNKARTLFVTYTTFSLWISRQKAIQFSFSNQDFRTQVNKTFVSLLKNRDKMGVRPLIEKLFTSKVVIPKSPWESLRTERTEGPPPTDKAGLHTPREIHRLKQEELKKNWFLALRDKEDGTLWVGRIRKTKLVQGRIEVHTYRTDSDKRKRNLSLWHWKPSYFDPRDNNTTIGGPVTPEEKLFWRPWVWWADVSEVFLPPFKLKKGKIPAGFFLDESDSKCETQPDRPSENSDSSTQDDEVVEDLTLRDTRPDPIHIFTDGSCLDNPGPCGSGVLVIFPESKYEETTEVRRSFALGDKGSNNIGELYAIGAAMDVLDTPKFAPLVTPKTPIVIHSDSEYSIGVLAKGWIPRANENLVRQVRWKLNRRYSTNRIHLHWVKGHVGNEGNEEADRLANIGSANSAKGIEIRHWLDPLTV